MSKLPRRAFLAQSLALLSMNAQPSESQRLKVVVAGGHPGDPEYGCGGTIAKYFALGHHVTLLYLNHGEKGCGKQTAQACASIRTSEAKEACRILGATPKFANQIDGEAQVDARSYDGFYELLQAEKPDVVFTHWPIDNHRDHRAMTNLVYDVWNRSRKSFGLYFYEVSDGEDTLMFSPTDYVDISGVEAKKRAACFAHASQSPERYYTLQTQVSRFRGTESGVAQAEAFIRQRESPPRLLP